MPVAATVIPIIGNHTLKHAGPPNPDLLCRIRDPGVRLISQSNGDLRSGCHVLLPPPNPIPGGDPVLIGLEGGERAGKWFRNLGAQPGFSSYAGKPVSKDPGNFRASRPSFGEGNVRFELVESLRDLLSFFDILLASYPSCGCQLL